MKTDSKNRVYPHYFPFRKFFQPLVKICADLFFPEYCLGCGKSGSSLCFVCLQSAKEYFEDKNVFAVFSYRNPAVKNTIRAMKFHGNRNAAKNFAPHLYDAALEKLSEEIMYSEISKKEKIWLVPIPLSKRRLKNRQYNQSAEIAKCMFEIDGGAWFEFHPEALQKIRETPPQTLTKNRKEREKNLRGAFQAKQNTNLSEAVILLIDDVTTTGTTFGEAERTLRKAGAKKVLSLAAAH
ncbi:MAG TPA: ComF family protein [Candidatus Paceibacterota bacterium]|nr:ComF family protein [Candidatus Paceibacterota bacterium]